MGTTIHQKLLKEWIKTIPNKENRKRLKNSVELQIFAEWLDTMQPTHSPTEQNERSDDLPRR